MTTNRNKNALSWQLTGESTIGRAVGHSDVTLLLLAKAKPKRLQPGCCRESDKQARAVILALN